jgi:hypothetical protein
MHSPVLGGLRHCNLWQSIHCIYSQQPRYLVPSGLLSPSPFPASPSKSPVCYPSGSPPCTSRYLFVRRSLHPYPNLALARLYTCVMPTPHFPPIILGPIAMPIFHQFLSSGLSLTVTYSYHVNVCRSLAAAVQSGMIVTLMSMMVPIYIPCIACTSTPITTITICENSRHSRVVTFPL